jgi:hypothetical protein
VIEISHAHGSITYFQLLHIVLVPSSVWIAHTKLSPAPKLDRLTDVREMQQCEELWKFELYVHELLNTLETATSFRVKATAIEGEKKKKNRPDLRSYVTESCIQYMMKEGRSC